MGLILVSIFMVFIFGFSLASTSLTTSDSAFLSIGSSVLVEPVMLRSDQNFESEASLDLHPVNVALDYPLLSIELPALRISNAKARFISLFERCTFYVLITANAP